MQLGLQSYKHSVLGGRKALRVEGTSCAKAWSTQELEHRLGDKVLAREPQAVS